MGNYLPKSLEDCTTDDLQVALHRMGAAYAGYSEAVQSRRLSGRELAQIKRSAQYEEICDALNIQNRLHRVVFTAKLKIPKIEDDDSPQTLVNFLNEMGVDYVRYTQPILDNCLCFDILGKIKLEHWTLVFEALGVTNLIEQNVIYNRIMDAASVQRARKRKAAGTTTPPSPPHVPASKASKTSHYAASLRSTQSIPATETPPQRGT